MKAFLSKKIQTKYLHVATFLFSGLFMMSLAVFSFADDRSLTDKNVFQDTDQDGLSNDEEKLYGTDSDKSDTDGDGYSDGIEVKSGYDPLKPAPGDKITTLNDLEQQEEARKEAQAASKTNLTTEVSRQVAVTLQKSAADKKDLTLDDLRATVQKTLNDNITVDTLPEVDVKAIKIKKQKYSKLSEEDKTAKIKADTIEYATAVAYILANNSPMSLQSDADMEKLAAFALSQSSTLLTNKKMPILSDIAVKGKAINEQLAAITVPENMLELHVKALRLAQYTSTINDTVKLDDSTDPLLQINSLAKIQGLVQLFSSFTNDMNDVLMKQNIQIPF